MKTIYPNDLYKDEANEYDVKLQVAIAPIIREMMDSGISHSDIFRLVNEYIVECTCEYRLRRGLNAARKRKEQND